MKRTTATIAAAVIALGMFPNTAFASTCEEQYNSAIAACDAQQDELGEEASRDTPDSSCEDNAAAAYILCLQNLSPTYPGPNLSGRAE